MIQKTQATTTFSGLLAPYDIPWKIGRNPYGKPCRFYKKFYHPFSDETSETMGNTVKKLNELFYNLKHEIGLKLPITKEDYISLLRNKGNIPLNFAEIGDLENHIIPKRLYKIWFRA